MKILALNTYAGSLLIAATNLRQEVIGSFEDAAFGQGIAEVNFPWIEHIPYAHQWPTQDLSETFVVAHPPCSAFSTMTVSKRAKGEDSKAFACTKRVFQYAVDNHALGLAVESVTGALAGAWRIHQKFADDYGYHVYRILQTGAMFSCQWRDRFWVVLIKKGTARDPTLKLTLSPRWRTVTQVVAGTEEDETYPCLDRQLERLKGRFRDDAGCTPEEMSYIFDRQDPPHPTTGVNDILWRLKFPKEDRWEICKRYVGTFSCGQMVYLDPNGLAPTLLGGSWWYLNGRNLSVKAYQRIAGFPDDYVFPTWPRNFQSNARMYMSKGVVPAVAEWVFGQVLEHLGERPPKIYVYECGCAWRDVEMRHAVCPTHHEPHVRPYRCEVQPNMIGDLRFRKRHWGAASPPLRHEDDYPTLERVQKKVDDLWTPTVTSGSSTTSSDLSTSSATPTVHDAGATDLGAFPPS